MAQIFCWEDQLPAVRADLQYLLDYILGDRLIGITPRMVIPVEENCIALNGIHSGAFIIIDRWPRPIPLRILDYVSRMPNMVFWHHEDSHLEQRYRHR